MIPKITATRGKGAGEWWRTKVEAVTAIYRCSKCSQARLISPLDIETREGRPEFLSVCARPDCRNIERAVLEGYR